MKKIALVFAMVIAFAIVGFAQTAQTITIGDTASELRWRGPVYFWYNNSYSQIIYLQEELQAGQITSISYQYAGTPQSAPSQIYMGEVDQDAFDNANDWIAISELTEVYQGTVSYSSGWVTITLDTPFTYSGMKNLVVAYLRNGTATSDQQFVATEITTNRFLLAMDDYNSYNPATPPTIGCNLYNKIPNTRFTIEPLTDFCFPVSDLSVTELTSEAATLSWTANAASTTFGIEYKPSAQEGGWITESQSINTTSYTLSDLTAFTQYDVKVYSVCASGNSTETIIQFTTSPSEDMFLTVPYLQNFDSDNSLDLWTLQNGANIWIVGSGANNTLNENGEISDGGALYISSDVGESNTYLNTPCISYAYSYVRFEQNTSYGLAFDWKCGGDQYADYGRVYLLPVGSTLSTDMLPYEQITLTEKLHSSSQWQRTSILIPDSCQGNDYMLVFAWTNNAYDQTLPALTIDNLELIALDCQRVDSIEVTISSSSDLATANLNIFDQNEDAEYFVEYRVQNAEQWENISGNSPIELPDLLYSTLYEVRITAVCNSTDSSIVSEVFSFSTPCGAITQIPYTESFETFYSADDIIGNRQAPLCWYNIDGTSGIYYFDRQDGNSYAATGTAALRYRGHSSLLAEERVSDWIISPAIELSGAEQLDFKLRNYNYDHTQPTVKIDIYVANVEQYDMVSRADTALFDFVETITHNSTSSQYVEYSVGLAGYSAKTRFAFAVRTPVQSFLIDDVAVNPMADCPNVYRLSAGAASSTEAVISFSTTNARGNGWVVAYSQVSTQEDFDTLTANTIIIPQDEDIPFIIGGLTSGQTYFFAVKQNCEGGIYSDIVSVTLPNVMVTLPYEQNFDNPSSVIGWEFATVEGSSSASWCVGSATNNTLNSEGQPTQGGALYVSTDGGTNNNYDNLSTATIEAYIPLSFNEAAGYNLSFDWKAAGESSYDYLKVYLVPLNETTQEQYAITEILNLSGETWQHFSQDLPSTYSDGAYKLVFRWRNDHSDGQNPAAAIDNLKVEALTCSVLSEVIAEFIEVNSQNTTPSILVNIVDNNQDVTYTLRYQEYGQTDWTQVENLTSLSFPYTIENIFYSRSYVIEVAAVCPDGVQTPFVSTQIVTPCGNMPIPWSESFSSSPFTTDCWGRKLGLLPTTGSISTSNLTNYPYGWTYRTTPVPNGGEGGCMRIEIMGDECQNWLITPSLNLNNASSYQIAFDVSLYGFNTGNNVQYDNDDKFAVLVSLDNGESWNVANGVVYQNGDADTEHNLSSITSTPTRHSFQLLDQSGSPILGTVKIAFYVESTQYGTDNYLYLDNIVVSEWSDCQIPTNLSLSESTESAATIAFTENGSSTQWEYTLAEGEQIDFEQALTVTVSEDMLPLSLHGLLSSTTYTIALRSICSEGEYSEWSQPLTFTTQDAPTSLPFFTDFEDSEDNAFWFTLANNTPNKWAIGTATFAGEDQTGTSAYISNDNGVNYAASVNGLGTSAFIYRDFDFGNDTTVVYNLSFDWKTGGLAYGDFFFGAMDVYITSVDSLNETLQPEESAALVRLYDSTSWSHFNIELTGLSGVKRLAFHSFGYYESEETEAPSAIDNLEISIVGCSAPEALAATDITSTTAEISWQGTVDSYEVSFRSVNQTEYTILTTSLNNITLTDLESGTNYFVSVKSICGNAESFPSDELTFRTECNTSAITAFPYFEGFESGLSCWTTVELAGNSPWQQKNELKNGVNVYIPAAEGAGEWFAAVRLPDNGDVSRLISPELDLSGVGNPYLSLLRLSLSYEDIYTGEVAIDEMKIYYRNSSSAEWTQISHYTSAAETWQFDSVQLPNPSSTYQIAFELIGNYANGIGLDNVRVYNAEIEGGEVEIVVGEVITQEATEVSENSAILNGSIVSRGNSTDYLVGFEIAASESELGNGLTLTAIEYDEVFSADMSDMPTGTYYFRAFLLNEAGFAYGEAKVVILAGLVDVAGSGINATLYPNPASDKATLSIEGLTSEAQIVVSDAQGRILFSDTMSAGAKTYDLNVASYAAGVYYIRIISGQSISTQKLIVR